MSKSHVSLLNSQTQTLFHCMPVAWLRHTVVDPYLCIACHQTQTSSLPSIDLQYRRKLQIVIQSYYAVCLCPGARHLSSGDYVEYQADDYQN